MTADLRVRLVSWTWTLMTMESMASANILTPAMDCRSESAASSTAAAASAAAEVPPSAVESQVWSLTQFYSVDFSQSRISVKKCVFNKRTKVFVSAVLDGVLGPTHLAWHTFSL